MWCKEANITMYVKTVCQRNARKARYNREDSTSRCMEVYYVKTVYQHDAWKTI